MTETLSLERWANFYVITSAAAATLIGLMFVMITVGAERRPKDRDKIRVYMTPVVIYFSSVLSIAALLTVPNHTPLTAAGSVGFVGIAGLSYAGSLAIRRGPDRGFYGSRTELFPYVIFPLASYALIIAGGSLLLQRPQLGLDLIAAGMFALLQIAIRDSWAIAIAIVSAS
jgi:hypothetical protein